MEDDNAEKLILRVRMVSEAPQEKGEADQDDVFLKRIEGNMLTEMTLRGIPAIRKVSYEIKGEWGGERRNRGIMKEK